MNLAEYKQQNRKAVTLPGGLDLTIKKLTYGEVQEAVGLAKPVALGQEPEEGGNVLVVNEMLIKAVVGPFKIVNKPVDDCGEDELSISDLDNADYEILVKEVIDFSGMKAEGAEKKSEATN